MDRIVPISEARYTLGELTREAEEHERVKDIIEEEAAAARANKDADFPSDAVGKHRNR